MSSGDRPNKRAERAGKEDGGAAYVKVVLGALAIFVVVAGVCLVLRKEPAPEPASDRAAGPAEASTPEPAATTMATPTDAARPRQVRFPTWRMTSPFEPAAPGRTLTVG